MRADIVALARGWLGTPYHHQASLKGVGCDCLGLVRGVYAEACGQPAETPPPYSRDWAEASARETMIEAAGRHMTPIDPDAAEAGDVLVFRLRPGAMAKHCAILSCAPGIRPAVGPLRSKRLPGFDKQSQGPESALTNASLFRMIHAIEGAVVCEVHVTPWWRRRIAAVYRMPGRLASARARLRAPVPHPRPAQHFRLPPGAHG
jgi:NlpC/P60 family putative phage cell wall peptidase